MYQIYIVCVTIHYRMYKLILKYVERESRRF